MAIKITGSKVKQVPNLEYIFVRNIDITQRREADDAMPPVYNIVVDYQTYGVDGVGKRTYSGSVETIKIEDFVAASVGKATRLNALDALEAAIADILADLNEVDTAQVV